MAAVASEKGEFAGTTGRGLKLLSNENGTVPHCCTIRPKSEVSRKSNPGSILTGVSHTSCPMSNVTRCELAGRDEFQSALVPSRSIP